MTDVEKQGTNELVDKLNFKEDEIFELTKENNKLEERIHTLEVYLEGAINYLILNGDVDNPIIKDVENILHMTFNRSSNIPTEQQKYTHAIKLLKRCYVDARTGALFLLTISPILYYNRTMNWKDKIKESLGKPYYEKSSVLLYNVNCIEALKKLPRNCIDLIVTSPPYNIGKEYEKILPIEDYVDWSSSWLEEIPSVLKENGAFWYNLGYVPYKDSARALPLVYLLWDKVKMYLMQEIVWNYGAGVACKKALSPRNEKWLWYVNNKDSYTFNLDAIRDPDVKYPNSKKNGKLRCNTLGKNPSDVWQIAKVTSGANRSSEERTEHPAQFPLDLIDRITLGFSNKSEVLLDPFMGSGTTAISALKNGRNVIGFEIREDYCELQAKRIDAFLLEQSQNLFAEFAS